MRATWILGGSAVLVFAVMPVFAQPVVAAKSGTIAVADGKVFLNDKPLDIQPGQFPDMKEKSVLRTEDGRAEVLLPPGMFMRIGENASFRMISNRLVDTRVELLSGSAVMEIDATSKDAQVTMIAKDGTVTFSKGIYRFDSQPARLKVFDGNANVAIGSRSLTVSTGKMIGLTGDTASIEKFDPKDTDSLDHWSRRRGEELAMANVSAAKRAQGNSWSAAVNPCVGMGPYGGYGGYGNYGGYGPYGPAYAMGTGVGYGAWTYNPWYGMYTYMPCNGMFMSPYGYNYFSPYTVGRMYYGGAGIYGRGSGGGVLGAGAAARANTGSRPGLSYSSVGSVSRGYAGVVGASSGVGSAAAGGGGGGAASSGMGGGGGHGGGMGGGGFGGGGHGGGGGGHGH